MSSWGLDDCEVAIAELNKSMIDLKIALNELQDSLRELEALESI